jgi:hypothetical protein
MNSDMWNEYELETDPFGDNGQGWAQRQLELEEQYDEEKRLDNRERARDINGVGKHYY